MDAAVINLFAATSAASASVLAFTTYRRMSAKASPVQERTEHATSLWRRAMSPIARHLRPTKQAELEVLTTSLLTAGRRSRDAIDRFCEERVIALFSGMVLALFLSSALGGLFGLLTALTAILLGIIGPSRMLSMKASDRREHIAMGLPCAVDLMTTCIEAGLSIEAAIARVAREIRLTHPILADELHITAKEFDAGVSLPDALRRLARRVGHDDLSALCAVIAQAHGLGAPVGSTLREYAESARRRRMSMLEERAGKLAAQLTIPLAVCLLPAAMIMILGPAVVQLVRALQ